MSLFICEYDWSTNRLEHESRRDRTIRKQIGSDWVQPTHNRRKRGAENDEKFEHAD